MNVFFNLRYIVVICITLITIIVNLSFGQTDSLTPSKQSNKKVVLNASVIAGWAGSQSALYQIWYSDYNTGKFHVFDDSHEWLYMDKLGHIFTNYQLTKTLFHTYSTSYSEHSALIRSTAVSLGFQTTLELMDGFSSGWGFSWTDMLANTMGASLFYLQHAKFKHQVVQPKFSFSPSHLAHYRPMLLGNSTIQQVFKDYNGQTYWYSFQLPQRSIKRIPAWINLAFGYSITNKLDAHLNNYHTSDGKTLTARTEFLCALDINLEKIPVKNRFLKGLFRAANSIKFPFPTIGYSTGKLHFYPIYF